MQTNILLINLQKKKSTLDYIWGLGDFRDGEHFGFFDNKKDLKKMLKNSFSSVEIHSRLEKNQKTVLNWNIAICKV